MKEIRKPVTKSVSAGDNISVSMEVELFHRGKLEVLSVSLQKINDDARITSVHISLFVSLLFFDNNSEIAEDIAIFSHEIMIV